jgi:hypothetical protein
MTTKENVYTIDGKKTLIDLNEDMQNFQLTIQIEGEKPFLYAIVDQTMLDNTADLNYEETQNARKTLKHKDKPYQNYFLVLRTPTNEEYKVKVTTYITDLTNEVGNVSPIVDKSEERKRLVEERLAMDEKEAPVQEESSQMLYAMIFLVLILIVIYILKKRRN